MDIREATPADIGTVALSTFAARTFPAACPASLSRAQIDRFIEANLSPAQFEIWLADPNSHVFVAEHDDSVIGYAASIHGMHAEAPAHWAAERTAYLSKLYVDEAQRGAGLARRLLDAALATARADRCAALWLGVNDDNARARAFYAKSGFAPVGRRTFTIGTEVFTDDMLAIPLTPSA